MPQAPNGLLQPLPVPDRVWVELTMDFIVGLLPSQVFTVIMVVVDRFTKYTHFGSLPTHFTTFQATQFFSDIAIKHHDFPSIIISDRSSTFLSAFWKNLFELSSTTLKHSTTYHPQTYGQTEVVYRGLE